MALAKEAEAAATEAEALAVAAEARARATRLRQEAQALTKTAEDAMAEKATEADPLPTTNTWRSKVRLPTMSVIAITAMIIAIFAFIGASVYIVWQHNDFMERQQRAASFLAGAKQGVINMTSLDFNKAKKDVQRVIDSSTGEFKDDFQERAADFTKVVEQSKAVTEGTINATAIESMDKRSALVLVSATSRITNSPETQVGPQIWRLRVTVTENGGQYKMSKVEFVP